MAHQDQDQDPAKVSLVPYQSPSGLRPARRYGAKVGVQGIRNNFGETGELRGVGKTLALNKCT